MHGARPRPSARGRRRRSADAGRRRSRRPTSCARSRAGRPMVDTVDLTKEAGEPRRSTRRDSSARCRCSTCTTTSPISAPRSCPSTAPGRPTAATRPTSAWALDHPAGNGRDARLQHAGAAHPAVHRRRVRRLHGLRQRLSRHGDPGHGPAARGARGAIEAFAAARPTRAGACALDLRAQFVDDPEVRDGPRAQGPRARAFGIFVDPAHCKGCGECVEVCAHLGHDALRMIDKQPATETTPSTVDAVSIADDASSARCRRRRRSTATRRRWPT